MRKQEILDQLGGIPEEVYDGLVEEMLSQARAQLSMLHMCLENGDYPGVKDICHTIKGVSSNLRCSDLSRRSAALEAAAALPRPDPAQMYAKLSELELTLSQGADNNAR